MWKRILDRNTHFKEVWKCSAKKGRRQHSRNWSSCMIEYVLLRSRSRIWILLSESARKKRYCYWLRNATELSRGERFSMVRKLAIGYLRRIQRVLLSPWRVFLLQEWSTRTRIAMSCAQIFRTLLFRLLCHGRKEEREWWWKSLVDWWTWWSKWTQMSTDPMWSSRMAARSSTSWLDVQFMGSWMLVCSGIINFVRIWRKKVLFSTPMTLVLRTRWWKGNSTPCCFMLTI